MKTWMKMLRRAGYPAVLAALAGWALVACEETKTSSTATADTTNDIQLDASGDGASGSDAAGSDGATADTLNPDATGSDAAVLDGNGGDADAVPDVPQDTADTTDTTSPDATDATGTDAVAVDTQAPDVAQDALPGDKEAACIASGGTVQTSKCCGATSDFPNLCAVGACGCAPEYSKDTKVCSCPSAKCFDGAACVFMAD